MSRAARRVGPAKAMGSGTRQLSGETMLRQAASVFANRANQYGEPRVFFEALAKRWPLTLGRDVTPAEVVRCMIDVKLERLARNPNHQDSIVDVAGFAAVLHEVVR
jgi:hypothetical protein